MGIRSRTGNRSVDFMVADLSSRADVRALARQFMERHNRLDVLVNNAGGIFLRRQLSVDGIEMTFALNHLGYFLLTNLLLEPLKASAPTRIINVASCGHAIPRRLEFDDLQASRGYRGMMAYHRSKLANLLFTLELARRLEGTGVTVNALHPGMVQTHLGENNGWPWRVLKFAFDRAFRVRYVLPTEGARTVVHLATSPDVEGTSGGYFAETRPIEPSQAALDLDAAARLWTISEELTGLSASDGSHPNLATTATGGPAA